jgi:hypothetical protein
MIRIDEIYDNTFWAWINKHHPGCRILFCDPFGRSDPESVLNYGREDIHEHNYIFFFDQEPIHLSIHANTFEHVAKFNADVNSGWYIDQNTHKPIKKIEKPPGFVVPGYLVTSERNSENVEQVCAKYNWKELYYFFHGWAALDWYRGYDKSFLITPWTERQIKKTFFSANRIIGGKRQHRVLMLYHFQRLGLMDNWISASAVCPVENIPIADVAKHYIQHYPDIVNVVNSMELPKHFPGEDVPRMSSCWLDQFDLCAESLIYHVSETVYTGRRLHLTEKTFKPIALGMPFVLTGTQRSLEYLRSYGFKTFDSVWDESYDQEPNDIRRAEKIAELLKSIDQLSEKHKQELFEQTWPIIEHNWNHFYRGGFADVLWVELVDMLKQIKTNHDLYSN